MAATVVKRCTCESEFQDREYGLGQRLHNQCKSERGMSWRCTVCGKEKK